MDTEGCPTQELSALLVDDTWSVVETYHGFARCGAHEDVFCRRHLHGLNLEVLRTNGFDNEKDLLEHFSGWLERFPVRKIYANDPRKERELFPHLTVEDVGLPNWTVRASLPAYQIALSAKNAEMKICGGKCRKWAHSSFQCAVNARKNNPSDVDIIKRHHGYHCSFYDSLMIFYI